MLKDDIIKRISDEYDRLIEKYEGHPLIEQEGILFGFADIINEFYDYGGSSLDNKERNYDKIMSYVDERLDYLRKSADNHTWDFITKSIIKIRIEELELLKKHLI